MVSIETTLTSPEGFFTLPVQRVGLGRLVVLLMPSCAAFRYSSTLYMLSTGKDSMPRGVSLLQASKQSREGKQWYTLAPAGGKGMKAQANGEGHPARDAVAVEGSSALTSS